MVIECSLECEINKKEVKFQLNKEKEDFSGPGVIMGAYKHDSHYHLLHIDEHGGIRRDFIEENVYPIPHVTGPTISYESKELSFSFNIEPWAAKIIKNDEMDSVLVYKQEKPKEMNKPITKMEEKPAEEGKIYRLIVTNELKIKSLKTYEIIK